ncbi:MAG TPA: lysylphosphatidylglycerol synthase domain-containing protein [Candidatus Dormibacteraeota bacterium]|nr:lysylphosphatidylglycerol synthase domain-containing protein [Candidatus Dormibacteraeota bacterium]
MSLKAWKRLLAPIIIVLTVGAFTAFIAAHPAALEHLKNLNPIVVIELLALYSLFMVSLVVMLEASLDLCGLKISRSENMILSSYSALINFFGPLQSGPGFRALYLKRKHDINLKSFGLASLLYYAFFAAFSALFLLSGVLGWQLIAILVILGLLVLFILLRTKNRLTSRFRSLNLSSLYKLALACLAQVFLNSLIYFIELRSVNPTIHFSQAIIYTGAANFALFVSFTPGAIGFREAFLLFSQHLHHITTNNIVSASLIDRGVYLLFLGIVFVFAISVHAKQRLQADNN